MIAPKPSMAQMMLFLTYLLLTSYIPAVVSQSAESPDPDPEPCSCLDPLIPSGSGLSNDPLNLCFAAHWETVVSTAYRQFSYRLCSDINFADQVVPPAGSTAAAFNGDFNGNFYRVTNYRVQQRSNEANGGLFGYADGATIYNLRVIAALPSRTRGFGYGTLFGRAVNSTFYGIWAQVATSNHDSVGGLFYTLTDCHFHSSFVNVTSVITFGHDGVAGISFSMTRVRMHDVSVIMHMSFAGNLRFWGDSQSFLAGLASLITGSEISHIFMTFNANLPALKPNDSPNGISGLATAVSYSSFSDIFLDGCFLFDGQPQNNLIGSSESPYAIAVVYLTATSLTNVISWVNTGDCLINRVVQPNFSFQGLTSPSPLTGGPPLKTKAVLKPTPQSALRVSEQGL